MSLKPIQKKLRFRFVSGLQRQFRYRSSAADLSLLVVTTNRLAVQSDAVAFVHSEVGS